MKQIQLTVLATFLLVGIAAFADKPDEGSTEGIDGGAVTGPATTGLHMIEAQISPDKTENKVQAESGYAAARAAQQAALKKAREQQ